MVCQHCGLIQFSCQLHLTDPEGVPDRRQVLYRYDPPVLLVSLTWHEKRTGFGHFLYQGMLLNYADSEEYVCPSISRMWQI